MSTSLERDQARVFQKYLTHILFNSSTGDEVEKICNDLSIFSWEFVLQEIFSKVWRNVTPNKNFELHNEVIWNNFCRFFLKGNKATLKLISRTIDSLNEEESRRNRFLHIMFKDYLDVEAESDFDFAFSLHPNNTDYNTEGYICYLKIVDLLEKLKESFQSKVDESFISRFITNCNDLKNQKAFLSEKLKEYAKNMPQNVECLKCIESLESNKPIVFKFEKIEAIVPKFEKPIETGEDSFLLFRLCLKCKCDLAPTLHAHKQIAELIDISLSVNGSYNEDLWEKSSLDFLLQPIKGLTDSSFYPSTLIEKNWLDYPIVNLNFQLKDAVLIFEENDPSKPESRCKRFIDQLRFFCLEEKQPQLPKQIVLRKKMLKLLQSPESKCYNLRDIFSFDESQKDDFVILKTKNAFLDDNTFNTEKDNKLKNNPNYSEFEKWCGTQSAIFNDLAISSDKKFSFYSACNKPFISKYNLIVNILDLSNQHNIPEIDVENLKLFKKNDLCNFFKDAVIILTCCSLFKDFCNSRKSLVLKDIFGKKLHNKTQFQGKLKYFNQSDIDKCNEYINIEDYVNYIKSYVRLFLNTSPVDMQQTNMVQLKPYIFSISKNKNFENFVNDVIFEFSE